MPSKLDHQLAALLAVIINRFEELPNRELTQEEINKYITRYRELLAN